MAKLCCLSEVNYYGVLKSERTIIKDSEHVRPIRYATDRQTFNIDTRDNIGLTNWILLVFCVISSISMALPREVNISWSIKFTND